MSSRYVTDTKNPLRIPFEINELDRGTEEIIIEAPQINWMQFVPGHVERVILNKNSVGYKTSRDINSIYATAEQGDENIQGLGVTTNQYYPLLSGMTLSPVKGDQVLLCEFGNIKYYLGPINTMNKPSLNLDPLYNHQTHTDVLAAGYDQVEVLPVTSRSEFGLSEKYPITGHSRLGKEANNEMDKVGNTLNPEEILQSTETDGVQDVSDIHGDTIFEGRHGNSIRLGSRHKNPIMIISNGRSANSNKETPHESILAMLQHGSIQDHFGSYTDVDSGFTISEFKLASDFNADPNAPTPTKLMEEIVSEVNSGEDGTPDPNDLIYNYGKQIGELQCLLNSRRVMINASTDSIYLSAKRHIHLGGRETLTITTGKDLVIDSTNTYIGKAARGAEGEPVGEPLVLGNTLLELLRELTGILKRGQGMTQAGPVPLGDSQAGGSPGTLAQAITTFEQKLETIISDKHFIEPKPE